MICQRLTVGILIALTAQRALAAELSSLNEKESARPAGLFPSGFEKSAATDSVTYQLAAMALEPPVPTGESPTLLGTQCKRDFHSICDCGCYIPFLGCYDCIKPCCVTDEWCSNPCECSHGNCYFLEKECRWVANDAYCDVFGPPEDEGDSALRLGGWAVSTTGSTRKTGEYQDLKPSLFYDVDGIRSDGVRTLDFTATGTDPESDFVHLGFYTPNLSAKLNYVQFPHELDHDPLYGKQQFAPPPLKDVDNVVVNDLNLGQDYAIRVQTLDLKFKGDLAEGVKWKFNVWRQEKDGVRQVNGMAHCFNVNPNPPTPPTNNTCHVLSQMQRIDWTTTEISPGLEARFGNMTVDYSYTWRGFDTNDESVYRIYNHFTGFTGPVNNSNSVPIELGIVPEDLTQMHKVKIGWVVNDCNNVYANLMYGATDSFLRDLHRWFDNVDLRWTNRAIEGVSYTLYGVYYSDRNSAPVVMGPPLYPGETAIDLRHPVDHAESRGGIRGNWRPFDDEDLSLVGRYEYDLMERNFATYPFNDQTSTFTQPDTRTNTVEFGPEMRWSSQNKSYVRYRGNFVENPLVGVSPYSQVSPLASALHTKQAEQEHRIELGHVWMPSTNFIVTSQVSLVERLNNTYFFNEQDYPFYLNLWYAPTDRLNLSAGYAYFSNAISQNMTLGDNVGTATNVQTETNRFGYAGIANVLSLSGTYAINALWALTAGYEYMRGSNTFNVAPSPVPGVDWSLLPSLSDVIVETNRVTAGVDYKPSKHTDVYFRYIFYGYNDISSGLDTGTANMFLAGASVLW